MFAHLSLLGKVKALIMAFVVLGLGVVLGTLVISSRSDTSGGWSGLWSRIVGKETRVDVSQPTVVQHIQQLQRLETVEYTMDKIISGSHESSILPDFLVGDRLLLLVHGQVVAGIDFARLRPADLAISGKNVRIRVPKAEIFSTRLDSAKTRVYSRQTGLLVSSDPNLETQVRQEAERQLHDSAVTDGILAKAQQNAQLTVTSLLQGLSFQQIEFE